MCVCVGVAQCRRSSISAARHSAASARRGRYSMAWHGMVGHGAVKHGMVRYGVVWCRIG